MCLSKTIRSIYIIIFLMSFCLSEVFADGSGGGQVVDKGMYYDYKGYTLEITSIPSPAKIYINDQYEGETPLLYKVEGDVPKTTLIIIDAVPVDKKYSLHPQSDSVGGVSVIPHRMQFDLTIPSDYEE